MTQAQRTRILIRAVSNLRDFLVTDEECIEHNLTILDLKRRLGTAHERDALRGPMQSKLNETIEVLEKRAISRFPRLHKRSEKLFYATLKNEHADEIDDALNKLLEVQTGNRSYASAVNHGISMTKAACARAGKPLPGDFFNELPESTPAPVGLIDQPSEPEQQPAPTATAALSSPSL